jgi:WD40 repeat protein
VTNHLHVFLAVGLTVGGVCWAEPTALAEESQPTVTRLAPQGDHPAAIRWAGFFPNGREALTVGSEGTARQWELVTANLLREFHLNTGPSPRSQPVTALSPVIAGDSEQLPVGRVGHGSCKLWDARTGEEIGSQNFPHRVSHLAFAPNGKAVAIAIQHETAPQQSTVYLWPFLEKMQPVKLTEQSDYLAGLAFSANGKTMVLVGPRSFCLLDVATQKKYATFDLPAQAISAVFSTDATAVVASEWFGNRLFIIEVATGRVLSTIQAPNAATSVVALSADRRVLASAQSEFTDGVHTHSIYLWETLTGKEVLQIHTDRSAVSSLAFSGDNYSLISGVDNATALVWHLDSGIAKSSLAQDLETLWAVLADENAGKTHEALWTMVAIPSQSVNFLRQRLKPVFLADKAKVDQWIEDLGSDKYAVRQAATKALLKIGREIEPALQKVLVFNEGLEKHRRLEQILKTLPDILRPESVRTVRAIMILERIGSPDAQAVLTTLAGGATGARETEVAKSSLERLKQRSVKLP